MEQGGAFFPIIFFDGEREIDLGTIFISPLMNFKQFQSLISAKIGISPHQITTYFTPLIQQIHRKRHPVTSKFNFAASISEVNSSFFLVFLKRSRRIRRRKPKIIDQELMVENNFTLLKRNPNPNDLIEIEYLNRLKMMMMMQKERDDYLMSMNLNSNVYYDMKDCYNNWSSEDGASSSGAGSESRGGGASFCDVCFISGGGGSETVPFHCCKNDVVTLVYKSPAGPISPPVRNLFY